MRSELIPLDKIIKYQLNDLASLANIENTAGFLDKLFSVNLCAASSYISFNKIPYLRLEKAKTSQGFKKMYSAKSVIDHAILNGKIITISKVEIEKLEEIENAKTEVEMLKSKLFELNAQIKNQEANLDKINLHLSLAFKRYNQLVNEPLLDEDSILFLAGIIKRKCGIYFLIKDEQIVYVGQSVNIENRIQQHRLYKDFDRFTFIDCKPEDLTKVETMYINKLKPKLNYNSLGKLVLPMRFDYLQHLNFQNPQSISESEE